MTTVNAAAADEFRRQICVGNIHEIVNDDQIKQYFTSYAGNVSRVEFHELRAGKKTSMDKDDVGHQVRYATIVFDDASSLGPALQLDGQVNPHTVGIRDLTLCELIIKNWLVLRLFGIF